MLSVFSFLFFLFFYLSVFVWSILNRSLIVSYMCMHILALSNIYDALI